MLTITQALNSLDATQEAMTNVVDRLCVTAQPLVDESSAVSPGTVPVTQGCQVSTRIQDAQIRFENILGALVCLERRLHEQLAAEEQARDLCQPL